MNRTLVVTQAHIPKRDFFDKTGFTRHLDNVPLPNLIFKQHHNAGEVVFHHALRTETNRNTRHTGSGEQRGNGNT